MTLHILAKMQGKEYLTDIFATIAFIADIKEGQPLKLTQAEAMRDVICACVESTGAKIEPHEAYEMLLTGNDGIGLVMRELAGVIKDYVEELTRINGEKKKNKTATETMTS